MGRIKGQKFGPRTGSVMDWLNNFKVGERRYVETTLEKFKADCKRLVNSVKMREHECFNNKFFKTNLLTAVGTKAGDVRYLICVERSVERSV